MVASGGMSTKRARSALFVAYDLDEPSYRHRMAGLALELERRGFRVEVERLPHGQYVKRLRARRERFERADVVVLHRVKSTPFELAPFRRLAKRLVYDVDDAIYYRRPRHPGQEPGRGWFRRYKFLATCAVADLVTAGNATLASFAARSGTRTEIVPTSVVVPDATVDAARRSMRTIVWIGLPENLAYLRIVRPVLARLAGDYPDLSLRVVSSEAPDWSDVPIDAVPWSAETEHDRIATSGIGIMPLSDDDWTRGKCAFKLLQYMAAGVACVGSDVGANREAIEHGETGFLASSEEDWERAFRRLLGAPEGAARMGLAGRERVRARYERGAVLRRAVDLVEEIVEAPREPPSWSGLMPWNVTRARAAPPSDRAPGATTSARS